MSLQKEITYCSTLANRLSGYSRGMNVQFNPHLTTHMALDEPPPACHENDNWGQRIAQMVATVEFVIEDLEGYF